MGTEKEGGKPAPDVEAKAAYARKVADDLAMAADKANEELFRVCRNPPRNFLMSIPVREDVDTDCIIGRALKKAAMAAREIKRLADALECCAARFRGVMEKEDSPRRHGGGMEDEIMAEVATSAADLDAAVLRCCDGNEGV